MSTWGTSNSKVRICPYAPATLNPSPQLRSGSTAAHDYYQLNVEFNAGRDLITQVHESYHHFFLDGTVWGQNQKIVKAAHIDLVRAEDPLASRAGDLVADLHRRSYLAHEAGATYCSLNGDFGRVGLPADFGQRAIDTLTGDYRFFYESLALSIDAWCEPENRLYVGLAVSAAALMTPCAEYCDSYLSGRLPTRLTTEPDERFRQICEIVLRDGADMANEADRQMSISRSRLASGSLADTGWDRLRREFASEGLWGLEFRRILAEADPADRYSGPEAFAEVMQSETELLASVLSLPGVRRIDARHEISLKEQLAMLSGGTISTGSEGGGLAASQIGDTQASALPRYRLEDKASGRYSLNFPTVSRMVKPDPVASGISLVSRSMVGKQTSKDDLSWFAAYSAGHGTAKLHSASPAAGVRLALAVEFAEQSRRGLILPGRVPEHLVERIVVGVDGVENFARLISIIHEDEDLYLASLIHSNRGNLFIYMGGHLGKWLDAMIEIHGEPTFAVGGHLDREEVPASALAIPIIALRFEGSIGTFIRYVNSTVFQQIFALLMAARIEEDPIGSRLSEIPYRGFEGGLQPLYSSLQHCWPLL